MIAALLGAGEVQVIAQSVEQRDAAIQAKSLRGAVDAQRHLFKALICFENNGVHSVKASKGPSGKIS